MVSIKMLNNWRNDMTTSTVKVDTLDNDGRQWFKLTGTDYDTGIEFDGDVYGLHEDGTILDADGCPLTEGDNLTIAVSSYLVA